jgi:signal transduction histidine kinase
VRAFSEVSDDVRGIMGSGRSTTRRGQSLDGGGRFLELLGVLSTRSARISHDKIDAEISEWLEQICRSLGLDRSIVAEYLPERKEFYTTYEWSREGLPPGPGLMLAASRVIPWISGRVAAGEIIPVRSPEALPAEAQRDRDFMLGNTGPKATLVMPLIVGPRLVGGITFEDFRETRQWMPSLVTLLNLTGDILANALERKRATVETNSLKDEVRRTARLALAGEMVAAMAHELSHPLGAILANAQAARRLLGASQPNLDQLKEALDDVITGERRAASYIAEVRSLFRRSELHAEPVRVDTIFDAVLSLLRSDLQARDISLQTHVERGLPMIAADRVGIEQVMINLIQNAADAVCAGDCSERRIVVRVSRADTRWVSVAVRDTGKGIDSKDLGRVFQPLFTTKPKGTGMGLAIVRSIVEAHGAQIRVHSKPGAGTTFEFALPAANDA